MDIQSTLSLLIQVVVIGFVSLVLFQGITGLLVEFGKAQAVATFHTAAATSQLGTQIATPPLQPTLSTTVPKNFDLLPDPWLNTEIQPSQQQEAFVLEFPTLKLLPPAAQVQPKARATKKSTKSTQPKSTKTSKTSQPKTAVTPRKSGKKPAA
jgi:hypothetical protein